MLMSPPPGYNPTAVNRQSVQRMGTPGLQGRPIVGATPTGAFASGVPGLSGGQLGQGNIAALLKALTGGGR